MSTPSLYILGEMWGKGRLARLTSRLAVQKSSVGCLSHRYNRTPTFESHPSVAVWLPHSPWTLDIAHFSKYLELPSVFTHHPPPWVNKAWVSRSPDRRGSLALCDLVDVFTSLTKGILHSYSQAGREKINKGREKVESFHLGINLQPPIRTRCFRSQWFHYLARCTHISDKVCEVWQSWKLNCKATFRMSAARRGLCYQASSATASDGKKMVGDTGWETLFCATARASALRINSDILLMPYKAPEGQPAHLSPHFHPLPLTLRTPG